MLARRGDLAVAHDVHVLAGALAHVAVVVEQDRLFIAGLQRLDLREHAVQVLARGLRVGDQRVGADAPPRGDLRADAVALALLAEVGAPLPAGDRHVDRRLERVEAHLAVAAVDDRADVAGAQAVARHQLERGRAQLLGRVGHRHVVQLGRAQQALDVLGVAEHRRAELGVVAAHAVEHARAVVQAVRQDVDLGVLPGDEFSVHPDEVGGLHVHCTPIRGCRALPWSPAPCAPLLPGRACAGPPASARSTPDSTAAASLSKPRPCLSIIAADRNIASGLARPCPAMSGAEPCTGSNMPGLGRLAAERRAGEHADRAREHGGLVGEDVPEHVLGEDRVEVPGR